MTGYDQKMTTRARSNRLTQKDHVYPFLVELLRQCLSCSFGPVIRIVDNNLAAVREAIPDQLLTPV